MAGRGPVPASRRHRRNKDPIPTRELVDSGELAGPELPDGVLPDGGSWHPQTVAMWQALRRWPVLADEPELTWAFLVDTMALHHTMWSKGRCELAAEVRLRLAKVGATPEDRLRLRLRVTPPAPAAPDDPGPGDVAARRRGLRIADGLID